ncbi:prephenate dehydrogenase [Anaerotardibacter muris]|uniref:prephenate dehydrogenase n=1 Tax=Anaerotardibacter muris TaxID=2941505 RepID=UPI00203C49B4|nr:prephenate dehydrogenase [Anaerotardibacter muris]
MDQPFESVAVVGLGVIGASFAGAYRKAYPDAFILGIDTQREAVDELLSRGWITEGLEPADPTLAEKLNTCDLVVLATPVTATPEYFQVLADCDYRGVVTDTCSTKNQIVETALEVLPHPDSYIPGHPMAGSEKSGVFGARADLFENAHWVLCPDEHTLPDAFAALHDVLTSIGARVVSLTREGHDEAVAIISHVPHFVASSLVELAVRHAGDQEALFRLAAGGFKDSTRIAAGSPELWTGIAFENPQAIMQGLQEMQDILSQYASALEQADRATFSTLLDRAAQARQALPAKWIPATEDLLEVRIPMTNRTGIIAEVTTIASQVGCNIQSIEIDHVTSSTADLVLILTDEGDIGKLSTQLIKAGFSISFRPLSSKE